MTNVSNPEGAYCVKAFYSDGYSCVVFQGRLVDCVCFEDTPTRPNTLYYTQVVHARTHIEVKYTEYDHASKCYVDSRL